MSELRDWQAEIQSYLDGESDDHTVISFVNPRGGIRKSWFQQYYLTKNSHQTQKMDVLKELWTTNKHIYCAGTLRRLISMFCIDYYDG